VNAIVKAGWQNNNTWTVIAVTATTIPLFLFVVPLLVYAGPEWDCDEDYIDIPGACECWHSGYVNGTNDVFNQTINEECKDKGNQYYAGFTAANKTN
jgi:hypothetical protein